MSPLHRNPNAAFVLLAINYALFGIVARELAHDLAVFQQVYLRLGVGFVLGIFIFWNTNVFKAAAKLTGRDWWLLVGRMICTIILGAVCYTKAILLTSIANVTFLCALPYPAIWGVLLFGEKLNSLRIAALILATAGAALIAFRSGISGLSFGEGEILAVLSGLFFALGMVARKYHSEHLTSSELATVSLLVGTLLAFFGSVIVGEPLAVPLHPTLALWLLGAGAVIAANLLLSNIGYRYGSAVAGGIILSLEMLFAVVIGWSLYEEVPLIQEWVGGALIFSGVIVLASESIFRGKNAPLPPLGSPVVE